MICFEVTLSDAIPSKEVFAGVYPSTVNFDSPELVMAGVPAIASLPPENSLFASVTFVIGIKTCLSVVSSGEVIMAVVTELTSGETSEDSVTVEFEIFTSNSVQVGSDPSTNSSSILTESPLN